MRRRFYKQSQLRFALVLGVTAMLAACSSGSSVTEDSARAASSERVYDDLLSLYPGAAPSAIAMSGTKAASRAPAAERAPASVTAPSGTAKLRQDCVVRGGPSAKGEQLAIALKGASMTKGSPVGSWFQVQYEGKPGFVHRVCF